ncbi:MFS transporter [soil metagenome]
MAGQPNRVALKARIRTEAPILLALFLDLLGFGMVLVDFQLRGEALTPNGWSKGTTIGILLASTFAIQIVASPRWGLLSDRIGKKPVLLACSALSAAAMIVYGLADSIWLMLLSRVLAGFGGANVAIAQAFIGDALPEKDRPAAIGRIGAAISSGLILGPIIGGFLAVHGDNKLVGVTGGICSGLGVIAIALLLPNHPPQTDKPDEEKKKRHGHGFEILRDIPAVKPFAVIAVVSWFSLAMLEGTFLRLIHNLFNYNQTEFGFILGYEAILGVVVQGLILGWVVKRIGTITLLRFAYCIQGIGLALNPIAGILNPPMILILVASTLFAVGGGLSNPTVNSTCSALVPPNRQGELFGLLQGARSMGFLIGPILGGWLFDWHPTVPYLFAGLVCVAAAVLVPHRKLGEPIANVIER